MIRCHILNPIRFYENLPDYSTVFPNMNNITQRVMYIDGMHPGQYYKECLYGKSLILQFEHESSDNTDLTIYKYNQLTETFVSSSASTGLNITPAGWEGNNFV